GRPGVLLLDEVAAHLDPVRRGALFERLRSGGAQAWLTGTELAPFAEIVGEAAVWRVSSGAVEPAGRGALLGERLSFTPIQGALTCLANKVRYPSPLEGEEGSPIKRDCTHFLTPRSDK